jgi:DNA modification methylase
VLDPFIGSGSTAVAAAQSGRRWVGYDISEEYAEITRKRVAAVEAVQLFEDDQ